MRRVFASVAIMSVCATSTGQAAGPLLASAIRAARQIGATAASWDQRPQTQQLQALGVGSPVRVTLVTGGEIEGTIAALETTTVDIVGRRDDVRHRVAFDDIEAVRFPRTRYAASGLPDPAEVRRVAAGLVGRHVGVTVAGRSTYRGHVQQASDDHLVLKLDRTERTMTVPYADVERLGPNLSTEAKYGLWSVALVLGLTVILTAMELAEEPDI